MKKVLLVLAVALLAGCAGGNISQQGADEENRAPSDGTGFISGGPFAKEGDPTAKHQTYMGHGL
jgi:hypothetical protein